MPPAKGGKSIEKVKMVKCGIGLQPQPSKKLDIKPSGKIDIAKIGVKTIPMEFHKSTQEAREGSRINLLQTRLDQLSVNFVKEKLPRPSSGHLKNLQL